MVSPPLEGIALPSPSCISHSPFTIRGPSVITLTLTAIVALPFESPWFASPGGRGCRPASILQIDMRPSVPMTGRLLEAMAHAGARLYGGERVSELAHALQCAELAEAGGADPHLTLACLLHDAGRFLAAPSPPFHPLPAAPSRAPRPPQLRA